MKKIIIAIGVAVPCLLVGVFLFFLFSFYNSKPQETGEAVFSALTSDVKVLRDKWGVPHIFAKNDRDLFFAVGYVQAQDRIWQMELLRRAGFGRLSEVFGAQTLSIDRFVRNYGFKEAVLKDYENLTPELKEFLTLYTQGVNAWMGSRRFNWPPEFLLLRYRPEPWGIMDSLIIKEILALSLCPDLSSELVRAKLVETLGLDRALEILEQDAGVPPLEKIPPFEVSRDFFSFAVGGSNNWVLAGSRTASGKPLLANDPHLRISLPSIWHEIGLHSPNFKVVGVSFPGAPLVVIGHNASIAWGVTNSAADVQDLYLERLNDAKDSYLDKDGWKPLLKKEEVIKVRGQSAPEKLEVLWTGRGPILSPFIIENEVPISLRWTISEGGRIYESLFRLNQARNWEEFCRAVALWDVPSQNFVYADVHGNIGYYLSGLIPLRNKAVGLFPASGWVEENGWQGFLEETKKPIILNPEKGYIVTANNKIVPEGYPYYISCDFDVAFRAARITELLLGRDKHTVDSLKKIQNDILSKRAELLLTQIKNLKASEGKAKKALEILNAWNAEMTAGKEAALFSVFVDFLQREILADELGPQYQIYSQLFSRKQAGLIRILSDQGSPWFDGGKASPAEAKEKIFNSSLAQAYTWLEDKYGPPEKWDWMSLHSLTYPHALGQVPWMKFFNRGPYPNAGDAFCIRASFSEDVSGDYATTWGVSYRQIIDLSDFRNSVCILSSGQSGHLLSKHYDDQIQLWLKGEYRPMLFDAEDVEANASAVFMLRAFPIEK
jgi:penicillin amidase